MVRRYRQNYRFEYLDLEWSEFPKTIEEKNTNQKTEYLINQKIFFLEKRELEKRKEMSKELFFPWAYKFANENKKQIKSVNLKPIIDHLLAFSSEKLVFNEINERFCIEFRTYLTEAPLSPRGLLKNRTTKQYFDHFKHLIKVCFIKKYIKWYSKTFK